MTIASTTRVRRTLDEFVDTEVDGELVFMNLGEGVFYSLKEAGIRTWQLIDEGGAWTTAGALVEALCKEFEVDEETCLRDLAVMLDELEAAGLARIEHEAR